MKLSFLPYQLFIISLVFTISCKTTYHQSNAPVWQANEYKSTSPLGDSIKIVSYNIKESKNIDQVISELLKVKSLINPEILLLQEMDEIGVLKISKALKLNYVYYPITYYTKQNRNTGNAILTFSLLKK